MDKNFLSKNFLTVINDSTALAQVFVVILFFENYLITFQQSSLFQLTIDFDSVELAPFLWFFVFIAGFKVLWWIFHLIAVLIRSKLDWLNMDFQLNSKIHFLAFLLVCLISFYFYNINKDDHAFAPFDVGKHPFLFNLFQIPGLAALLLGALITLFTDIKYAGDEK